MDVFDGLKELIKVRENIIKQLEFAKPLQEELEKIQKINSQIQLPKFDFPKVELDTKIIETPTKHNSSYGWTATGQTDLQLYLDEELISYGQEELDTLFLDYYEMKSMKEYFVEKNAILKSVEDKWIEVMNDCFDLYETGKYKIIIPMLTTIIESEITTIYQSQTYGYPLMKELKDKVESEEDSITRLVATSLADYLKGNMFKTIKFHEEREESLNRN